MPSGNMPVTGRYWISNRDPSKRLPPRSAAEPCDCQHIRIDRKPWYQKPALDREPTTPAGHSKTDEDALEREVRFSRGGWAAGW